MRTRRTNSISMIPRSTYLITYRGSSHRNLHIARRSGIRRRRCTCTTGCTRVRSYRSSFKSYGKPWCPKKQNMLQRCVPATGFARAAALLHRIGTAVVVLEAGCARSVLNAVLTTAKCIKVHAFMYDAHADYFQCLSCRSNTKVAVAGAEGSLASTRP